MKKLFLVIYGNALLHNDDNLMIMKNACSCQGQRSFGGMKKKTKINSKLTKKKKKNIH